MASVIVGHFSIKHVGKTGPYVEEVSVSYVAIKILNKYEFNNSK
jgi:hypothetical protein